ncbi:hypothetical protein AAMO2058_000146200 [Amorphochlora amoebiformis]
MGAHAQILDYGILLVPYGPTVLLVLVYIFPRPQLFVVAMASSVFFLAAFACSSILRLVFYPIRRNFWFLALITIASQECFRNVFIRLYFKVSRRFLVIATNGVLYPLQDLPASATAGLAWGITNSIMLYGDVMMRATGMATLVSAECGEMSVPVLSSWASLLTIGIHVCLMILGFDALRRSDYKQSAAVCAINSAHLLLSSLNIFRGGCIIYLVIEGVLLLAICALLVKVTHQPGYHSKRKD